MSFLPIFELISNEFVKQNVPCLVVGGVAVNYHGAVRQTEDVDFLISDQNAGKVAELLQKAGYKKENSGTAFLHFRHPSNFMKVDFLLVDEKSFSGIFSEAQPFQKGEINLRVPSLEHLIALKLHAIRNNQTVREYTDLPDIINLIRVNQIDPTTKEFRELCLKYGSEGIYAKILNATGGQK